MFKCIIYFDAYLPETVKFTAEVPSEHLYLPELSAPANRLEVVTKISSYLKNNKYSMW